MRTFVITASEQQFQTYLRLVGGDRETYRRIGREEQAFGLHPGPGIRVITYGPWWESKDAIAARLRLIEMGFNPEHAVVVEPK